MSETMQTDMGTDTQLVVPGDVICSADECHSGTGVLVRDGCIIACIVGKVVRIQQGRGDKQIVSVVLQRKHTILETVIEPGDIILCRVTRITITACNCEIISVGDSSLREREYPLGVIRREDIRPTETDKLEMHKCFQPGDIVRARVISLGDVRQYFLSTSEVELGVRWALSPAGEVMSPVSWQEMECPKTKIREFRKCARPQPIAQP